ncbi:MAG TPA: hypothetical protein VH325_15035, partial [Bryobacteraceae bacterium]|nr:hypothetical protein [Bryobacteraceae bacterium]
MPAESRRAFLAQVGAGLTASRAAAAAENPGQPSEPRDGATFSTPIDFRYAPLDGQSTFCFPDDPYKSLVGSGGELRYGHPGTNINIDAFAVVVHFSAFGMESDRVTRQYAESSGVPVFHTWIERPEAQLELITFATNRPEEGRVDNVILQVHNRTGRPIRVAPLVRIFGSGLIEAVPLARSGTRVIGPEGECFMVSDAPLTASPAFSGWILAAPAEPSAAESP